MKGKPRTLLFLWALDLVLLAASILASGRSGIDIYYHDTYFVITLQQALLVFWLVFTIPLLIVTLLWRRRGGRQV